jgi:hypothetical protein
MKINSSYPYPVLCKENDDYKLSRFDTEIYVETFFDELKIHGKFQLEDQVIQELLDNQKCAFAVHVECPQTCFRKLYKGTENVLEITIPQNQLLGKVTINSFIIATEPINNYSNEQLNDWYQGVPLSFEKGHIMAVGKTVEISLFEDDKDMLNLPSIVTISKNLKKEYMDVEIHYDNILIYLPEYEYNQYAYNANSSLKFTILSNVILPCLVYVFSKIQENKNDLEGYNWYKVMEKIFHDNNMRLEDVGTDSLSALKAAQLILRKPIKKSFEEIESLFRTGE